MKLNKVCCFLHKCVYYWKENAVKLKFVMLYKVVLNHFVYRWYYWRRGTSFGTRLYVPSKMLTVISAACMSGHISNVSVVNCPNCAIVMPKITNKLWININSHPGNSPIHNQAAILDDNPYRTVSDSKLRTLISTTRASLAGEVLAIWYKKVMNLMIYRYDLEEEEGSDGS